MPQSQTNTRTVEPIDRCGFVFEAMAAPGSPRMVIDRPSQVADRVLRFDGVVEVHDRLVGPVPLIEAKHVCVAGTIRGAVQIAADTFSLRSDWRDGAGGRLEANGHGRCCGLESVSVNLGGDLSFTGDVTGGVTRVAGWVDSAPAGRIVGGHFSMVRGGAVLDVVAHDGAPATLSLAQTQRADAQQTSLNTLINKLTKRCDACRSEAEQQKLQAMIQQAQEALVKLGDRLDHSAFDRLEVHGVLAAGTVLMAGAQRRVVEKTVIGACLEVGADGFAVTPLSGPGPLGFAPETLSRSAA